jgi:very-short-patch-repair endonuclease
LSDVIAEVSGAAPKPSVSWLREAWKKCERGALPLVGRLTSAEQVRQLSRALDPRRLVFALSVVSAEASAARVRGLARAAEWLSHESQAKTILLVPGPWQGDHELDHVTYEAVALSAQNDETAEAHLPGAGQRPTGGVQVLVGPIVGRPHPASDVEKLLHERLTSDTELSGLFEFNQRLTTQGDKRYIADVVWRQGGLVIEIDGDEHCRPLQYNQDRERDYRMYMSGYTTLRVTNDEVHVDVDRVLTKIRNMVGRLKASGTTAE